MHVNLADFCELMVVPATRGSASGPTPPLEASDAFVPVSPAECTAVPQAAVRDLASSGRLQNVLLLARQELNDRSDLEGHV